MQVAPMTIGGAWVFTPKAFGDDRGLFLEWFKADVVAEATGHKLSLAQANHSISAKGVLRGVHYATVPPSQAKYVYCPAGAVLDVVVDIRVGSPTFGQWDSVLLDSVDRRAVYISEGLGHVFMSLADGSNITYLCSTGYNPTREFEVNPTDPALALPWPTEIEAILSDKDLAAPTLAEAAEAGRLPDYQECLAYYRSMS